MGPVQFQRFGADQGRYHVQQQHKGDHEGGDDEEHREGQEEPPGVDEEPIRDR